MKAEAIAETHNNNKIATISLLFSEALETVSDIRSAIISINPMNSSPCIIINKPAKKIIVVHSTDSNGPSTWCGDVTKSITTAPTKAITATDDKGWEIWE